MGSRPEPTPGPGWCAVAVVGGGLIMALAAGCGGPSESYSWGEKASSTAETLVKTGVKPDTACDAALKTSAMWADNPALNPTPPPKNFNKSDAMKGCLNKLNK